MLLQVTSVYRDQFDGLMRHYATVIEALSEQEDPANPIAAHSRQLADALRQRGWPTRMLSNCHAHGCSAAHRAVMAAVSLIWP